MLKHPAPRELINAFHLMWDNFPEPVGLVHKSREVAAVNKGHFYKPGDVCARSGHNGPHAGCLANQALSEKKAVAVARRNPAEEKDVITYWLPFDGYPDYFIHFSIRIAIDYENRQFTLSPITDEARENYSYLWDDETKA